MCVGCWLMFVVRCVFVAYVLLFVVVSSLMFFVL